MKKIFKSVKGFCKHQYDLLYYKACSMMHEITTYRMKKDLVNKNITIISSDCTGGLLYHDLGLEFKSPTINMAIEAHGFVELCSDLKKHISQSSLRIDNTQSSMNGLDYPIMVLGDSIYLHGIHYHTTNEFIEKWNSRKNRINYNDIFCIFTAKDGFDEQLLPKIDAIPHKKVLLSNVKYDYDWCVWLPQTKGMKTVGNVTIFEGLTGKRRYETCFDWVKWFNGADTIDCMLK